MREFHRIVEAFFPNINKKPVRKNFLIFSEFKLMQPHPNKDLGENLLSKCPQDGQELRVVSYFNVVAVQQTGDIFSNALFRFLRLKNKRNVLKPFFTEKIVNL